MAVRNFDTTVFSSADAISSAQIGASKNLIENNLAMNANFVGSVGAGGALVTSVVSAPAVASTYYKLRGWNSSTQQFEVWTNTDPYSLPPSQTTLLDITYTEFNT